MLSYRLEARFREAIGEPSPSPRDETIGFAVDFVRLLAHALPDPVTDAALRAVRTALQARTDLTGQEADTLVELACTPEHRAAIDEDQIRAFGDRFGRAREEALRTSLAEEVRFSAFAERYGAIESLLLLDALFAVCGEDGVISRNEIAGLQKAAADLQIDPVLVSALFRKHDSRHATGDFQFQLERRSYVVGRSGGADIQLPDPQVGHRHVELVPTPNGWRILDLGSGRPTLLNGVRVASAPFRPQDELRVGPYALKLGPSGDVLTAFGKGAVSALSARGLKRRISARSGDVVLLDDVSFTVFSGEVIALVGPSGAGKTTLLHAITGIAPPDDGDVLLDDQDFHRLLQADRSLVGVVPQEDVVHAELTVEESLRYAARLRLGAGVSKDDVDLAVDRVLRELGIEHIRGSMIGDAAKRGVSGGQRKRVSLGQELLTASTRVLFLDEPTSGLDPQTAQDIVAQVRQLADDGRIVFLVTHDVSPTVMSMVDHLIVLAPGGRLAWFGPPEEANAWFGVSSADEIFGVLGRETPQEWAAKYREGPAHRKYVRTRAHVLGLDAVAPLRTPRAEPPDRPAWLELATLTRRYATVKLRDRVGMAVLLGQAPLLAAASCVVFPQPDVGLMFVLVLSALWFGASGSVRELIAERSIWRRERRIGVGVAPYVASKVLVLGTVVTLQCLMLTATIWAWFGLGAQGFALPELTGVVVLTGLAGMGLGLALSALFRTSEAAVGSLPLVLIPQITFGGLIVRVKDMGALPEALSTLTITRYAFEAAIRAGDCLYSKEMRLENRGVRAILQLLGFGDASGPYQPISLVLGALFGFAAVFVLASTWLTARAGRAEG